MTGSPVVAGLVMEFRIEMNRYPAYVLSALVLVAVAFGVGNWLSRPSPGDPENVVAVAHDPSCDLRAGTCRLALPGSGEVELGILPRGLPPMAPLELDVKVTGALFEARWIEFSGVDMDMGFNRASLERIADGRFAGTGIIPVCVSDRMAWEVRVVLSDGDSWVSVPFRFDVVRN